MFWVDPKERLVAVLLTQAQPEASQRRFKELFRQLVTRPSPIDAFSAPASSLSGSRLHKGHFSEEEWPFLGQDSFPLSFRCPRKLPLPIVESH